jgi:hypothetical protein
MTGWIAFFMAGQKSTEPLQSGARSLEHALQQRCRILETVLIQRTKLSCSSFLSLLFIVKLLRLPVYLGLR